MKHAIINGKIYTGEAIVENAVIVIEDGKINDLASAAPEDAVCTDLKGAGISAGLIDIQVNGGLKHYFSQSLNEESLHDICDASLKYGATHTLPCLISSPQRTILEAIETVGNFMSKHDKGVMGMHLEGPFINPVRRGAHIEEYISKPTNERLREIIRHGKGIIKVMTIAPECFTDEQIGMLVESGIHLSAGHSAMTCVQAQYYFSKGIKLITHLYNAMTPLGHREPGLVGAIFDNTEVFAPIILDGYHCDYAAARIAYKVKGDHLCLISDACFLGREVNEFHFGEFDAKLIDGSYRNKEGNLAGAAISMVEAVRNAMAHLHVPIAEALKMATVHAARAIGMEQQLGYIKPGYPARFMTFTDDLLQYSPLVIQ